MTPAPLTWEGQLVALQGALDAGDRDRAAAIDLPTHLGPLPAHLQDRATSVLGALAAMERETELEMAGVTRQLHRIGHRPGAGFGATPPPPSQLDCSA